MTGGTRQAIRDRLGRCDAITEYAWWAHAQAWLRGTGFSRQKLLTSIIFEHGGTFDKFIGDAVMAFFGAPVAQEDDAHRAVEAACRMQLSFHKAAPSVGLASGEIALGIGIHTGEVIVGNIGSDSIMDYTVVGDAVNIAQRLQEEAWPGQVLLSQATYETAGKPPA